MTSVPKVRILSFRKGWFRESKITARSLNDTSFIEPKLRVWNWVGAPEANLQMKSLSTGDEFRCRVRRIALHPGQEIALETLLARTTGPLVRIGPAQPAQ